MPLPAASPTCGHVLPSGALGQGRWGMRWPTVLGCLGRLALSGIGWGLRRGVWGPGSSARPVSEVAEAWRGQWAVAPGSQGALSGGFLCSLLGGCVVVPAVGFPGPVLRGGCWWPGSCGPLCLLLIAGGGCGLWPYTLIHS